MIYKQFYLNVIIRFIIILTTCLWLTYEINNPKKVYTIICISAFLAIQAYSFVHYFNKTNRELARFFLSLGQSIQIPPRKHPVLSAPFNKIRLINYNKNAYYCQAKSGRMQSILYLSFINPAATIATGDTNHGFSQWDHELDS